MGEGFYWDFVPNPSTFFFSRKKKKARKKKFAGCMNFAKNRTLFPKMPKLGTSSLKQVCIS